MVLAGNHVGGDLRVRLGCEFGSFSDEFGFEVGEVFDNSVMNQSEFAAVREVRVGVDVVRCSVGRPARVADSGVTVVERVGDEFVAKSLEFA